MAQDSAAQIPKFIKRLMPSASELELIEATETFKRYMVIMRRIYERIATERAERDSSDW